MMAIYFNILYPIKITIWIINNFNVIRLRSEI